MMKKIQLTKDDRNQAISDIKRYFLKEREEEIGDLSAGLLLDFISENIGPLYYNDAIKDAYTFITEKAEDLFGLEKTPRK